MYLHSLTEQKTITVLELPWNVIGTNTRLYGGLGAVPPPPPSLQEKIEILSAHAEMILFGLGCTAQYEKMKIWGTLPPPPPPPPSR